ncbi:hypothetical protein L2E82_11292 [Cichorium intybus]|uniref:Uncharacterized protein n=1 Tax=Cichorium intybus TaxID=13427 RepID=A0ACB9GCR4_CICIN|nr:hypothetical protein L2E82_11292 [Cichorium intybus]
MELDTDIQTEALSKSNLKAIMEFLPFNKYFIGEKAGLFKRKGSIRLFTQILFRSHFLDPRMNINAQGSLAYKRVGSMVHNGEKSHGIIGVLDVTDVMDDGSGRVWVHNNKQGFVDCEPYALLEDWLSKKADDYLDSNIDKVHVPVNGKCEMPEQKLEHGVLTSSSMNAVSRLKIESNFMNKSQPI